jgi:chloramphenicol-sensitive protein RarD
MDHELRTGLRAVVTAYVLWGALTIYWHELDGYRAIELIGWRMLFATIVMAVAVSIRRGWSSIRAAFTSHRTGLRITAAAILLVANWTAYVWTIVNERVIESALGYFMSPIGTTVIGIVVLHERTSPLRRLAVALAAVAVGVLWVAYGRLPMAALVIAASWSVYSLLKRQIPLGAIEGLASETFVMLVPAGGVVLWESGRAGALVEQAGPGDWSLLSMSGLVTAVPLALYATAAKRVPFTVIGPLQYIVPIINFALGWLVYGEELPASRLVGFLLVWGALAAVTIDTVRANRTTRMPTVAVAP